MKYRILLVCLLLSGAFVSNGQKTSALKTHASKPNIILIVADDLGYGDLGVYGQQKIKTPKIDQLAHEGMRFSQFYAGTTVCAPSRSSLMTGQHTGHTPIRGNKEVRPEGQWPLKASAVTVAELMKKAGYTTAAFGKWGLGFVGTEGDPLNQGFDRFYGYNCQAQAHNYFPDHLWDNDQRIELGNTPTSQTAYAADMIHQKALSFITEHKDSPLFICLTYTLPHAGLQIPKNDPLFEYYKKAFNEKPVQVPETWNGVGYQPQAYPKAAYAAMVGRLDRYVGDVIQTLQKLGLDKNTLVFFTSDNGPHHEGGNDPAFFNSSGVFRGIKRDLYEGGIRVPMIARWPGRIRAGSVTDFAGAFWDFLPTFASLAAVTTPREIDGVSMLPTLLHKGTQQQHEYLYWEFHEGGGSQAVRAGKWKAIRLNVKANPNNPLELFDLSADPAEKNNVAKKYPDIVKKMGEYMRQAHVENTDFPLFKP